MNIGQLFPKNESPEYLVGKCYSVGSQIRTSRLLNSFIWSKMSMESVLAKNSSQMLASPFIWWPRSTHKRFHGCENFMGVKVSWVRKFHGCESLMGVKISWVWKFHGCESFMGVKGSWVFIYLGYSSASIHLGLMHLLCIAHIPRLLHYTYRLFPVH